MAIFKAVVHSEYAQIPNSTLQDKSLTFEARGLLAMLLSLPEDWEIHKSWLQGQSVKCGRDKLTRMLKELQDSGYVRKKMNQRDDGKFSDIDWLVYPTAQLKTRSTENPSDGKPATTKETIKQRNKNTNIGTPNGMPCKTCGGVGKGMDGFGNYTKLPCHDCQGSGVIEEQPCKLCDGNKYLDAKKHDWDSGTVTTEKVKCPDCNGTGVAPVKTGCWICEREEGTGPGCATCKPEVTGTNQPSAPNPEQTAIENAKTKGSAPYPDEFEWVWKNKPQRIGANPKRKAYNACRARLKEGATWRELAEGMKRYSEHCKTEQKLNSQYVMQLATFFGPDEHFKEQWQTQQKAQEGAQAENPTTDPESYTKAPEITQEQLESTSKQLSNLKGLL